MKINVYKDLWKKDYAWFIIPTVIVFITEEIIAFKLCFLKSRFIIEISK